MECVCFSPNEKLLATGGFENGSAQFWEVANGQQAATLDTAINPAYAFQFTPLGDTLIIGSENKVEWFNLEIGVICRMVLTEGSAVHLDLAPDGWTLAVGTGRGHMLLIDLGKGSERIVLHEHIEGRVFEQDYLMFSPN